MNEPSLEEARIERVAAALEALACGRGDEVAPELRRELAEVRAQTRSLGSAAWGVAPQALAGLDVEAALAATLAPAEPVLEELTPRRARPGRWRRRSQQGLQLAAAAAGVLLVSTLSAPQLLRQRLAARTAAVPASVRPAAPLGGRIPGGAVFWTVFRR